MINKVEKWLFPYICILCGLSSSTGRDLCQDCHKALPWLQEVCTQCAMPLWGASIQCGTCLQDPPLYERMIALFPYQSPITHLITHIKFRKKLMYAHVMGDLFADHWKRLSEESPECLIPVPLHSKRLKERGYNQALEVARTVSKKLHIPLFPHICQRIQNTVPQSTLSAEARLKNIRRTVFKVNQLNLKRVAIFDDVVTTGATVNALSEALLKAGAKFVEVWCIARTIKL